VRNSSRVPKSCSGSVIREIQCENHVISAFILTDILLLCSYFFGIYLFSRDEAEYLSKLADQVSGAFGLFLDSLISLAFEEFARNFELQASCKIRILKIFRKGHSI